MARFSAEIHPLELEPLIDIHRCDLHTLAAYCLNQGLHSRPDFGDSIERLLSELVPRREVSAITLQSVARILLTLDLHPWQGMEDVKELLAEALMRHNNLVSA